MAQTTTPTATVDPRLIENLALVSGGAQLLRLLADLLEAGAARPAGEPTQGTLLDVDVGAVRCVVIRQAKPALTLSPREAEVARMVAHGLTNRAIATALDISLWTVSTHLRRIFAKLGVNNRAEMVALTYAAPAGLA